MESPRKGAEAYAWSQIPAESDRVRPILSSAFLVVERELWCQGALAMGAGYCGKRTDQKCRQSHLDSHKITRCAHGCQLPLGIPPAVAVCLLSSATSSSQPHVTHSASTHLRGKPQPATPYPAPPQTTEQIPCLSQFIVLCLSHCLSPSWAQLFWLFLPFPDRYISVFQTHPER